MNSMTKPRTDKHTVANKPHVTSAWLESMRKDKTKRSYVNGKLATPEQLRKIDGILNRAASCQYASRMETR